MKNGFIYYTLFLLVFCLACTKPHLIKPTMYLSQDIKDYTDFKAGSYWIYQDTINPGHVDSIVLISHNQVVQPAMDGSDGQGPYEKFTDTLWSSIDGKFMANGSGMLNDYHVQYPQWPNDETTYLTPISGAIYDEWGNTRLVAAIDSLKLDGKLYRRVKEFRVDPQIGYKVVSPITDIFWAQNLGVVQKTVSGNTWQLIRYHVAQ